MKQFIFNLSLILSVLVLPLPGNASLLYSTYLGGSDSDYARSIAVDNFGNAYITGYTFSADFPTTSGAYDNTLYGSGDDVFIVKLNPTGTALIYSTFLGGNNHDEAYGIAVDNAGNVYVAGQTLSTNFPTTLGAYDTTANGGIDTFISKLNSTGSALVYSTYLGGNDHDYEYGIAVDTAGNAYVTGQTGSYYPTTPGAYDTTINGYENVFVSKINPTGTALVYSTFIGGDAFDYSYAIAADNSGNAYVTGKTQSQNFPTTPGAFDTTKNSVAWDMFVCKLNPAGSALVYSTFLGGSYLQEGYGITADNAGNAYVTGHTESPDFPTTSSAFDTSFNGGGSDTFISKLNATGSALIYSTFIGGNYEDFGQAITIDNIGNAYLTGYTWSADFPTTPGAFDGTINTLGRDAFVSKLDSTGSTLLYSTYLGGSVQNSGYGIAVDNIGNAYVTGYTLSPDFPTTPGAFDTTFHSGSNALDAFVSKLKLEPTAVAPSIWKSYNESSLIYIHSSAALKFPNE
jgi:hypothetical protein